MKQLVVPAIPAPGEMIELTDEQLHYLVRVRRIEVGTEVACMDESGRRARTVVAGDPSHQSSVVLHVVEWQESASTGFGTVSAIPITLYVALLKGKKLDAVVRQVTELGVNRIVPVVTRHCISRPGSEELLRKRRRWVDIAREATQQSGRLTVPTLEPAAELHELESLHPRSHRDHSLWFVFHETADDVLSIRRTFESSQAPGGIRALVGPEGGLAPEEVQYLSDTGWRIRRMPAPVLRAETAAVAAATLVQSLRSEYTPVAS